MDRLLMALPFVLSAACASGNGGGSPTTPSVRVDQEFTLAPGQTGAVNDASLRVRFDEVTSDSRCPEGVQCVWEGDAAVAISVSGGSGAARRHELHTSPADERPAEAGEGDYVIRLVGLQPGTRASAPIPPGDYRATFVVRRR